MQQAKTALTQAQAALGRAQQNLRYCTIQASVKAVIIDRRVNIGQTVVSSLNAPSLSLIAKDLTRIQVWASVTNQNNVLQNPFTGASRAWSFGPAVSWPIFQGGSIRSNIHVQEALRDQAFLTYQKTGLTALQEVENALIAFDKEWEHSKALNDAVVANRKAVDLSMQLYAQGQTDFLNVLEAQRSLYVSEAALVQSTRNTATDLIALYKALDGGWDLEPSGGVPPCCG